LGFSLIVSAALDARPTRIGAEYLGLARDFRRQVKAGDIATDKAHSGGHQAAALIAAIYNLWWPVLITL
jgi:hypothetical protein